MFEQIVSAAAGYLWSMPMVGLCFLVGLIYTVALKGFQITHLKEMWQLLFHSQSSESGTSSFESFALSAASRIGTGNIVGTVTAIAYGGPGSILWMWIYAVLGAATTFMESSMGQVYKKKIGGYYRGGPAYYIDKGLGQKWLAVIFAIACVLCNGYFNLGTQTDSIAGAMQNAFGIPPVVIGVVVVAGLAAIIFGGLKRIANFASKVVPFMGIAYMAVAALIILVNITRLPACLATIISSAFGFNAMFGGLIGSCISWGVKRGVYSSEAGRGSASHAAANAEVSHPAKQGLVQAFSVYVDTIFVCSATAFTVLITGLYNVYDEANGMALVYEGLPGVEVGITYTQRAMDTLVTGFGQAFLAFAILFFAFTTLLAQYNTAETNLYYLVPDADKGSKRVTVLILRLVFLGSIFLGAVRSTALVWALADVGTGMTTWLTLLTGLCMVPMTKKVWEDYLAQKKAGVASPIFRPSKVGIRNAEMWEQIADDFESGKLKDY